MSFVDNLIRLMVGLPRESDGEKDLSIVNDPIDSITFVNELTSSGQRRPNADSAALQLTMSTNELVFACLHAKATAALDPRLIVQQRTAKNEYIEVPGHPMRQLMMRPNPQMTEADLMKAAIVSWDISNPRRFFCEKVYKGSFLTELYPLNPARMAPKYSHTPARDLIGYTWTDGTHSRDYSLDELIIRSAPVWYDPPPLPAALGNVKSDIAQTDFVSAFFENGGIPPGILKYDRPLNDQKREEIRDKWRAAHGNRYGRQHDIAVLDVSANYQEIGSRLDQLSSQVLRSVSESRVCMVFGVPPLIVYAYVGLIRATYSNLKEAWANFWDATMSPTFKELRAFWTIALLPEFEYEKDILSERVRLQYDMSQVAFMQEDVDAAQTRARANFSTNGINLNEFRAAIGYPPVSGGESVFAHSATPSTAPAGSMSRHSASRNVKSIDKPSMQLIERKIEKSVKTYLQNQYRAAADVLSA
jgi:HK97 family phage portal protein